MSRTDKTDPMWVRIMDPANRGEVKEVHNHSDGVCDLADFDPREGRSRYSRCYLTVWAYRKLMCNCSTCTGNAWNNWQGAWRTEWRAQRQAWLHGWGEYRRERMARKYWYD